MTRGCCGQVIYCVPSLDLVVVTTAKGTVMDNPSVYDQIAYMDLLLLFKIYPSIIV